MAAASVANRREVVMGSQRCIEASITTTTSSDTWVTGLKVIRGLVVGPGSNAAPTTLSVSGGTVTIASSGGVTAASGMAWGY